MAKIGLPKGSGKRLKVNEKSGNFEMHIEWQPCLWTFVHQDTQTNNWSLAHCCVLWEAW